MIESFDQKDFSLRVREELKYLGMEIKELALCIYVREGDVTRKLRNKMKYKPEEVKGIEKVLG